MIKRKSIITFLLISILITSSCRRDEIVPADPDLYCDTTFITENSGDTVLPSKYLMTFPGSWWAYDNDQTTHCTEWVYSPLYTINKDKYGCTQITANYSYRPAIGDSIVNGGSVLENDSTLHQTKLLQIIGNFEEHWYFSKDVYTSEGLADSQNWYRCDSIIDSKEVNGVTYSDVIRIIRTTQLYFEWEMGGPYYTTIYYFAREVGLIKYVHIDSWNDTTMEKGLVDYYIAPY